MKTDILPLLPMRQGVLFPGTSLTVGVGRPQSMALLKALERGQRIAVGFQRDPRVEDPALAELHPIGVYAELKSVVPVPNGGYQVVIVAHERLSILALTQSHPYWKARVE